MARQYKITKATYDKLVGVIFEYAIINDVKAPKWFAEFVEKRFDPLAKEVAEIKVDVADLKVRMANVECRLDNLETKVDTLDKRVTNLETER
ncbi:MAG: hypothetical protein LBG49_01645 [Mycoplasmataceae bacterium]|jgi:hypothetical protein|nr:hypothetical protein [Mycoplasmataceae bacterium]